MCVAIDPRDRTQQFHVDKCQLLFKGGFYSRAASIQGRLLFKGGFYLFFKENFCGLYSRAASIQGRLLFKKIRYPNFLK